MVEPVEVDLEEELSKIIESVKLGVDAEKISETSAMQINLLCCIASLLLELINKVEDTNESLENLADLVVRPKIKKEKVSPND